MNNLAGDVKVAMRVILSGQLEVKTNQVFHHKMVSEFFGVFFR